ncbi:MAG: hypothetical protein AAFV43_09960 [Planctomycetota bacterium]
MTFLALTKRGLAAMTAAGVLTLPAAAQFVSVNGYQAAAQPAAQPTAPSPVYGQSAYVTPPGAATYPPQATPTQRPAYAAPAYAGAPQYRMAQTLPEPVAAAAEAVTAPVETLAPTTSYTAPNYGTPTYGTPMTAQPPAGVHYHNHTAAPAMSYTPSAGCATGDCGTGGCATGDCNQGVSWESYAGGAPACDYAPTCAPAPVCNVAPAAPRRQWFAGVYGLFLQRADVDKQLLVFCDDISGYTPGTPYYYEPGDVALFTDSGGIDGQWGAEVRFGSTFGAADPCGCQQPFAWEVGYWALNDDSQQSVVALEGTVGASGTTSHGLFHAIDYTGLMLDADGAGTDWGNRDMYEYTGKDVPESGDIDLYNTRLLGVRVRSRFEVQNLELNFWRFGCPVEVGGLGLGGGRLSGVAGGPAVCGAASCGAGACSPAACAPCRPPRRFFINGLAGVRYLRVDDDLGIDSQWTQLTGTPADPPAGWPNGYESFPRDDNSVWFHDVQADNQLVGFQLGCSMNWLVGCKWSLFADSNFGVYGNQMRVRQTVVGGGASEITRRADGGAAVYSASETDVAFLGELRTGIGYQVGCNCRLTAAYRLIGVGGLALGVDNLPQDFTNANVVNHISNNGSVLLHGLQTGVEWSY